MDHSCQSTTMAPPTDAAPPIKSTRELEGVSLKHQSSGSKDACFSNGVWKLLHGQKHQHALWISVIGLPSWNAPATATSCGNGWGSLTFLRNTGVQFHPLSSSGTHGTHCKYSEALFFFILHMHYYDSMQLFLFCTYYTYSLMHVKKKNPKKTRQPEKIFIYYCISTCIVFIF